MHLRSSRVAVRLLPVLALVTFAACNDDTEIQGTAGAPSVDGGAAGTGGAAAGGASAGSDSGGTNNGGTNNGGAAGDAATGGSGPVFLDILSVGDSITWAGCWRAVLWNELNQNYPGQFDLVGTLQNNAGCLPANYDMDNQGYAGALVTEIVDGITDARTCIPFCPDLSDLSEGFALRPDVILMHLGTNDVWVHDTMLPATILAAYTKVVAAARVENPSVRFLVAQIIPMNPRDPNPSCDGCAARVTALNAKIPAWAAENSTEASPITVVDQWTGFDVVADTYDGVHPNGSGSAKMAARWFAALEPLFQ